MANYVISTCSTCDLSREWLEARDVRYIYFNYEMNGAQCKDDFGQTYAPADLYALMLDGADVKTSQVSVGEYIDHWRPFLEAGKDVLHIAMSSGISGTYSSACTARDTIVREYPDRKVIVIDSLTASAGLGLLVDKAADLRDEGYSLEDLAAWVETHKLEVQLWFVTTDLTFLIRGGRLSKAAGFLGGMLNICPMMDVEPDGTLAVREKIRTKRRAFQRQLAVMEELCQHGFDYDQRVFITNSECLADAKAVAKLVESRFHKIRGGKVEIFDVGATIGCHLGPGTVVLAFWGEPRTGVQGVLKR